MIPKHYILVAFLVITTISGGQNLQSIRYIDSIDYEVSLDSLKSAFINIEDLPENYELAFYTALSFYPELQEAKIKVKECNIKTTLNMRPTLFSVIFNKRDNRQYVLRINKSNKEGNVVLPDVPYQASIGLFGHEFAHVVDYSSVNAAGIFTRGIWYMFSDSRMVFEHSIDQMTIDRGLGWQLYEWSHFVLNSDKTTPEYKHLKRTRYLTPDQIISSINHD